MTPPLLELEDLTVQYRVPDGDVTAVSNASVTVEEGEYVGLVGESGCGKSTIAKALIGALDANGTVTSGTIRYKGEEIQDYTEEELNKRIRWGEISLIPQSSMDSLDPLQRIGEQAREIAKVHGVKEAEAMERFRELFETMGIRPDRVKDFPHQFSGGMQQRAIIALALFLRPSLIIADEPTTALDVIMQDQIFKYLDRVKQEVDTSMLLITHDISLVFESCKRVAIMHGGQVAESGATLDIYDSPRHPYGILLQEAFPDVRYPKRELEVIEGSPPREFGEVTRCTFVDRCPWAIEECHESEPALEPVSDVNGTERPHLAACFRKDEVYKLYQEEGVSGRTQAADQESD